MIPTLNPETYGELLAKYQPKIIENDLENQRAIMLAQELAHKPNPNQEESALLKLLIVLIESYEERHYPLGEISPQQMLIEMMEQRNIILEDLVEVFGSREIAEQIITGGREMNQKQIKIIANFLQVNPELFKTII